MKALGTAFAILLGAAVAFAAVPNPPETQQPGSSQPSAVDTAKPAADGAHAATGDNMGGDKTRQNDKKKFKAEVVSTDATARTITVRRTDATGTAATASSEMTLSVDPSAESMLAQISAGDMVKLVSKTDASGKQVVSKIERVDARPAGDQPPATHP
jgi:hypothetical protein